MQQQYRSVAEDRLLKHLSKVAAKSLNEGNLEQSQELYEHLVHAYRGRHGDRHPLTVVAIGSLSGVAEKRGEFAAAEELAREAVNASTETLGALHPDSLHQLCNLAQVLTTSGKLTEAESAARSALDGYRNMHDEGHSDLVRAENLLARSQQHSG